MNADDLEQMHYEGWDMGREQHGQYDGRFGRVGCGLGWCWLARSAEALEYATMALDDVDKIMI